MHGTPIRASRARVAEQARRWYGIAGLVLTLAGAFSIGAAEPALEYRVKSGFLFNFLKFVEWPSNSFGGPSAPVVVGVMEDDAAAPVLRQVLGGKPVNGRTIEVRLLQPSADARACHLLFLGRTQAGRAGEVLERLKGSPVLTVGEFEQFCQHGGMINLVRKDESFRFEINLATAGRAGLKISSRLAGMAIRVKDTE